MQPAQYSLQVPEECKRWTQVAALPENAEKMWIVKPVYTFHGAGITVHKGPQKLLAKYGNCMRASVIIMDYIDKPATVRGGYKFDLRTYLLVASEAKARVLPRWLRAEIGYEVYDRHLE